MELERLAYTARGALSYYMDQKPDAYPVKPQYDQKRNTHIVFTFWKAPEYPQAKMLMRELQARFKGDGLPIGVGLFTRPMGDVTAEKKRDFAYDPQGLNDFLQAAVDTDMPVFINTSGMQWTEVAYKGSPLLRHLEERGPNWMKLEDGSRVKRKLQPPGTLLRGLFGSDSNGVLYLSPGSPEVKYYRERNLAQMAEAIKPFSDQYPDLFLGVSTENEVDYPGKWITGGKKLAAADEERKKWDVRNVLKRNIKIFQDAGLPNIYTNQSVEDAVNRGSPLGTAALEGSNIGITTWRRGNMKLYNQTQSLAGGAGIKWALVVSNPLSLSEYENFWELQQAIYCRPAFIGLYNWWPHFWGYSIRGMPIERAVRSFTK